MELMASPLAIQGKFVPWATIARYFDAGSVDELLLTMWRHRRSGYYSYEVCLAQEYIDWEEARTAMRLRTDVLEPYDPFGALKIGKYRLNHLYDKIRNGTQLTEDELNDVIEKFPAEIAERYLLFRLIDIDEKSIGKLVTPRPVAQDEDYDTVEYCGLEASGSKILFRGKPIRMGFQHRQVVRVLINKHGGLCTKDDFTEEYASVFSRGTYDNIDSTLRKLISAVRKELHVAVGYNCIISTSGEGWSLNLAP